MVVDRLRTWDDPAVRYQSRLVLDELEPGSAEMRALAEEVRTSSDCGAIIAGSLVETRHVYRKWQGPHWALVQLAERGHPGRDPRLQEIQEVVFGWILSPSFLQPNWTRYIEGQPERVRRCASMEGNVLWALRTEDEKLIVANANNPRGLPEREYFDVSGDPLELDPYEDPDAETRLEELAEFQRAAAQGEAVQGEDVEMDLATCQRLKAIGYVEDCSHLK